MIAVLKLKVCS